MTRALCLLLLATIGWLAYRRAQRQRREDELDARLGAEDIERYRGRPSTSFTPLTDFLDALDRDELRAYREPDDGVAPHDPYTISLTKGARA